MALANIGPNLYEALLAEGFKVRLDAFGIPEECANVEVMAPADGLYQLRFTINVTGGDLAKIGRALARVGGKYE